MFYFKALSLAFAVFFALAVADTGLYAADDLHRFVTVGYY